ncbi:peptidylprolyl isomerase [Nanoarchaeota archaeon]
MAIKKGDTAVIEYEGTLDDGKVFDSSKGRDPLEFEVGSGKVIKGFDTAVIGMEKGEEKEIKLTPKDSYGERNEGLVKEVPKKSIPPNIELKEGLVLLLKTPEGQQIGAQVKEIKEKDEVVIIDMNHPLAGKNLTFKIKLVNIK